MGTTTNGSKRRLDGLEKMAFQHPSDLAMLARLERIPLLPTIVGKLVDIQKEVIEVCLAANCFQVTQKSLPDVYSLYMQACNSLCVDSPPPLYIEMNPRYNGYTMGADKAFICLTSGVVSEWDEDELIYLMGHELGHVISGHVKYKTLVNCLSDGAVAPLPIIAQLATNATLTPLLMLWSRRSEYTCDRAGLLACQSLEAAQRAQMKLAGFPKKYFDKISAQSILEQAESFRERVGGSWLSNVFALGHQLTATHPRLVERASELQQWVDDGWYDEIINGNPASRTKLAKLFTGDPLLVELLLMVSQSIIAVCVKELNVSRDVAAPLIRQVIYDGGTLKDTPVQTLLKVELVVEKIDSDKVRYELVLLINKQGNAVRQKYQLPMSEDWEDVAKDIREEFLMKRENQIIRQMYSI